ncbi:hypothetical protein SAMN04489731_106104 [Amycolatopsis regifaucium]|nr:hypothetical protein SAMN04489731_106104 [Amycolatopsis regifaucium]
MRGCCASSEEDDRRGAGTEALWREGRRNQRRGIAQPLRRKAIIVPEAGRHAWFVELWITDVAPVPCATRREARATLLGQ